MINHDNHIVMKTIVFCYLLYDFLITSDMWYDFLITSDLWYDFLITSDLWYDFLITFRFVV